jgi:hypothetical protein
LPSLFLSSKSHYPFEEIDLLSILTDRESYDNGEIIYKRDLKVGYLEQSPKFYPEVSASLSILYLLHLCG